MFSQEIRPIPVYQNSVYQNSVGLKGVPNGLSLTVLDLKLHGFLEEGEFLRSLSGRKEVGVGSLLARRGIL